MTVPGMPSNVAPPGDDWIPKKFKQLEWEIAQLRTAQPYAMSSWNFDGTLDPPTVGTRGWGLTRAGDAIINTLYLRDGIVGDAALANPVSTAVLNTQTNDTITYSASLTSILSGSLTVPTGFSQALVMATATAIGYLDAAHSTQQVAVNVQLHVGSTTGPELPSAGNDVQTPACQANTSHSALLTGVSGTVPISLYANGTYTAAGTGTASLAAIAVFLR